MPDTRSRPAPASPGGPVPEETKVFDYLGHQLLCTARPRAGRFEAQLVVQRRHRDETWQRLLSTRCGILPSAEEAFACARTHGETWVVQHG